VLFICFVLGCSKDIPCLIYNCLIAVLAREPTVLTVTPRLEQARRRLNAMRAKNIKLSQLYNLGFCQAVSHYQSGDY
jgi:hypothetical protein